MSPSGSPFTAITSAKAPGAITPISRPFQAWWPPARFALNRFHRRHAKFDHAREFLGDGLRPGIPPMSVPKTIFTPRWRAFLNDGSCRDSKAIARAGRSVCRSPIVIVGADGRHVPGALLQHLGDGRVVEIEAVFDGIAAAIECAMQPDAAISVAGNFLSPAMGLVDDRTQFLDCKRGL